MIQFILAPEKPLKKISLISFLALLGLMVLTSAQALAHPGWGIVVNKKGEIYFGDVNRNIVWKIDTRGIVSSFIRGKHSHTLHIHDQGNIYGDHVEYDRRNDRWLTHGWMATPEGRVSILNSRDAEKIFKLIDSKGNECLFHGDAHKRIAEVLKVSPAGDTTIFAGGTWGDRDGEGAQAQFRTFGPAVWGPDQCLYFGSGGIIRKLSLDGTVTTLAGREQGFGNPDEPRASGFLGIIVDSKGTVYAAHWEKRKVIKISRDGTITTVIDGGIGWSPSGVVLGGNDLYVLEHRAGVIGLLEKAGFGGPRVVKVSLNGKITVVGTAP